MQEQENYAGASSRKVPQNNFQAKSTLHDYPGAWERALNLINLTHQQICQTLPMQRFCKGSTFSLRGRQPMRQTRPKAVFSVFCCIRLCEYLCKWCCIIRCAHVKPDTYLRLCNTLSSFNMESRPQQYFSCFLNMFLMFPI